MARFFQDRFTLDRVLTGRKRLASELTGDGTYSGEINFRKLKRRNTEPNSEPLIHGIMDPVQEQASVTASGWLAKEHYNRSNANVHSGFSSHTFPGRLTDSDKIFDVRPGDSMFSFVNHLRSTGIHHPRVFSAINGMSHQMYTTSEDMDGATKWLGFAMAPYSFQDIGTDKVPISMQVSTSRSIINNGDTDLLEGDVIAMKFPMFNKSVEKLDDQWALGHSGHPRTTRLIAKTTKVTPAYITDSMRDIFYKLLIENEKNGQKAFFPTSDFIPITPSANSSRQITDYSPTQKMAIAKHNELVISGMAMIKVLVENGILDFAIPGKSIIGTGGVWNAKNATDLMNTIAKVFGFAKPNDAEGERRRKVINKEFLLNYYRSFAPSKLKHLYNEADKRRGYSQNFIGFLNHGVKLSQDTQNSVLLNRLDSVVGVVTKGNKRGQVINGDFGRPKYVV